MSPSWEATNCSATQELPNGLWNPMVHYSVHKSPPLVPILRQISLLHTTIHFRGPLWHFITNLFLSWGVVSPTPILKVGGPPLVNCPIQLIHYIHSYPPYQTPSPASATWGRAMPWWKEPTWHGHRLPCIKNHLSLQYYNRYWQHR
jgi:hypothetical protein